MIHLVGLPHTELNREDLYSACAFTSKANRMLRIWCDLLGESVTVYWGGHPYGDTDPVPVLSYNFISLLTPVEQQHFFGAPDRNALPSIEWGANLPYWELFLSRAAEHLRRLVRPGDIIAFANGNTYQNLRNMFPDNIAIEPMVGYGGPMMNTWWATESYAQLYFLYGRYGIEDHRQFDVVVPTFVDQNEFMCGEDEGYLLFMGRCIARKGVRVAGEIAGRAGLPLYIAGAGGRFNEESGVLTCTDGTRVENVTKYLGVVNPAERAEVLAGAKVLLMPTLYVEPGGNVAVEALMSGVPVVAPDGGGVFTDIINSHNGTLYRTLSEAVDGVGGATSTTRRSVAPAGDGYDSNYEIRAAAKLKYDLPAAADHYARWFGRLRTLHGQGWYA